MKEVRPQNRSFRVAVFCSANNDLEIGFFKAAEAFGRGLAERRWELIYGGARGGLMGCFADAVLKAGGVARGATTEGLATGQELVHPGLQELVIVPDLFDRKKWMMAEADCFVIFPGGFGTLDEALEAITWKALKCHDKPIMFVNLEGFWQSQMDAFKGFASRGMIRTGNLDLYQVCDSVDGVWKILDGLQK